MKRNRRKTKKRVGNNNIRREGKGMSLRKEGNSQSRSLITLIPSELTDGVVGKEY